MIESKSGKTRISAPAHPSATDGRVSGLVLSMYAQMSIIVHFGNVLGRRYSFVMTTKQDLDIVLPQLSLDPHSPRFTILIGCKSEQELDCDTSLL